MGIFRDFFYKGKIFLLGSRLHDFSIGTVLKFSSGTSLFHSDLDECFVKSGEQPAGIAPYQCNKPVLGRYLVVYLHNPGPLTLCEVQVFGIKGKIWIYRAVCVVKFLVQ